MKLAALLLSALLAFNVFAAEKEYTVKVEKEVIVVTETQGVVITLPRTEMSVSKEDGEIVYATRVLFHQKGKEGDAVMLTLAVLDRMCNHGSGQIGVLNSSATSLLSLVEFDYNKDHKSPSFVAKYICTMGKGQGKATTKTPLAVPGAI